MLDKDDVVQYLRAFSVVFDLITVVVIFLLGSVFSLDHSQSPLVQTEDEEMTHTLDKYLKTIR